MGRRDASAERRKLDLLAKEGVRFHAGKLIELSRIFTLPDRRTYPAQSQGQS